LRNIRRTLRDIGKVPNFFLKVIKRIKKDIMNVKNIDILASGN
jgi:hypothetical protein